MGRINSNHLCVIHVISSAGLAGGERYLGDLIRYSAPSFDHFVILSQKGPFEVLLQKVGIAYAVVGMRHKFSPATLRNLIKSLRHRDPHILHTHGYRSNMYGRLAAMVLGLQHMSTVHVSLFDYRNTPVLLRMAYLVAERLSAAKTRIFICVSRAMFTDLLKLRIPKHKIRVIPNGVDLERFHPRPVTEDKKKSLGLIGAGPIVGCVGRLTDEKGQIYLVDAVAELQSSWPDMKCVFIGDGPLEGKLNERTRQLGVESNCLFLGGRNDVEELYACLDLFVLPSIREPFGIALLEAMASGVPVIASAAGGPLEYIRSGLNGVLVPPGNSRLLAQEIHRILKDRELAEVLGAAGRRTALNHFDVRNTVRKTEEIYLSITRGSGGKI